MEVKTMRRKQYTGEEKIAILRKHLPEGIPVSDVCDEPGLQPTAFYRWQKQLFEQGAVVFRIAGQGNRPRDKSPGRLVFHVAS
jgi:transposase